MKTGLQLTNIHDKLHNGNLYQNQVISIKKKTSVMGSNQSQYSGYWKRICTTFNLCFGPN